MNLFGFGDLPWYCASGIVITVTAVLVRLLIPQAAKFNLVSVPIGHSTHAGAVPKVGGIAIFVGLMLSFFLSAPEPSALTGCVLALITITFVMGLIDDQHCLAPKTRLLIYWCVILGMMAFTNLYLHQLGTWIGLGTLTLSPWLGAGISLVVMTGLINAYNMIDGIDGLVSLVGLTTCMGLIAIGKAANVSFATTTALNLGSALVGFLSFNLPKITPPSLRCFMVDSGSTVLGLSLCIAMLTLSQGDHPVSPVVLLWLNWVALTDLFWSIYRRLCLGVSLLNADQLHIHHLLQRWLKSDLKVTLSLASVNGIAVIIGVGVYLRGISDTIAFAVFMISIAGALVSARRAL